VTFLLQAVHAMLCESLVHLGSRATQRMIL